MPNRINLRRTFVNIHLWLGITLGVVGALLGITGSVLVFDDAIDARFNPQRYAVSGPQLALPYTDYVQRAAQALEGRARPMGMQLPDADGGPVVVNARPIAQGVQGFYRVYIDPPTGRVLDIAQAGGVLGWIHQFHGSLMLRDYGGRAMVGIVGIAMLISALSGIYLWWPSRTQWPRVLGFRPGIGLLRNLHYFFGFYGSLVLALLSFTGIYIAFPDAGRAIVGAFGPVSAPLPRPAPQPQARGEQKPAAPQQPRTEEHLSKNITPDQAAATARSARPDSTVVGIGLPTGPKGNYRVTMREPGDPLRNEGGSTVILIDPRSGEIQRHIDPSTRTAGDDFLAWLRPLHTGEAFGIGTRIVVFIVGLLPPLLVTTGTLMWLRRRRAKPGVNVAAANGIRA